MIACSQVAASLIYLMGLLSVVLWFLIGVGIAKWGRR